MSYPWPGPDARPMAAPRPDSRATAFPAPEARAVRFPPAPKFAVLLLVPALGTGTAGVVVLLTPWRNAAAVGAGVGSAAAAVAAMVEARATGAGIAAGAVINTEVDATANGAGRATAAPIVSLLFAASAAGSAVAGTVGRPIAVVQAFATSAGAGSAAIVPGVLVAAHATGIASAVASAVPRALVLATAAGAGTAGAAVVVFRPSGMTKSGTQNWAVGGDDWLDLISWTPNTGTYPGSSISANRLVVQGTKTNAAVSASVGFSGAGFASDHRIRLVNQSGAVLVTGAPVSAQAGTCTASLTGVNLSGITTIGVQMSCPNSFGNGSVSAGAATSLTIT
ncbi:hypothetical protein ACQPW1_00520 [Nocardia sp. CA-128927]|uniref:hypothetical protein n=1 Tax=Nocardia sp. CA-128927 TaxID=3239975 RepID=UPI003D991BB0